MQIGKVVGTIWATRKDERLAGLKLMVVQPLDARCGKDEGTPIVAADVVGSGVGETVLLVGGSSARGAVGNRDIPVDASIVGILDTQEIQWESANS